MDTRNLIAWCGVAAALLSAGCASTASREAAITGQKPHTFSATITTDVSCDYLLYLPEAYGTSNEEWPLLLYLHGGGESGSDVNEVASNGPAKMAAEGEHFPFIMLSPLCPKGGWWPSPAQAGVLKALLDEIVEKYRVDEDRIYVTGLSMGGFGAWSLADAFPDRFAAIAPVCGGGEPITVEWIKHIPVWVFHGAKDTAVPLERAQEMVTALEARGANVKFTVYPDTGHDSWDPAYANPALYEWLLVQKRGRGRR